jgi:pantoate--beta-alanine ligase
VNEFDEGLIMQVVETVAEMKRVRSKLTGKVGFVPTMGYLHEGHLELVRRAKAENKTVVVSIFVNPAQFGPKEDFEKYPRDPDRDLALLQSVGTDYVFMPTPADMYPPNFNSWVEVQQVTERLEGAARPGHFRGVATIVTKLFNIVQPTRSYFGQKDAQQCAVIKKMVKDLEMPLAVIIVPTVREPDGLAMSSRNVYLTKEMRQQAPVLYQSLQLGEKLWKQGETDASIIRQQMVALIQKQPLAQIEYIDVADTETLAELKTIKTSALVSMVVRFGHTRLLDNIILE